MGKGFTSRRPLDHQGAGAAGFGAGLGNLTPAGGAVFCESADGAAAVAVDAATIAFTKSRRFIVECASAVCCAEGNSLRGAAMDCKHVI